MRRRSRCGSAAVGDPSPRVLMLVSARVELPGATKMERFVARGRCPADDPDPIPNVELALT